MNSKIAFPELVNMVAQATSTTPRMSELFLKELFATISQALMDGDSVTIKRLGTFEFVPVAARKSVDVNTGQPIEIPGHDKLVFTPDKALAQAVNLPFAAFESVTLSDGMTDDMLRNIDREDDAGVSVAVEPAPETGIDVPSIVETEGEQEDQPVSMEEEPATQVTPPPFPLVSRGLKGSGNSESSESSENSESSESSENSELSQNSEPSESSESSESSSERRSVLYYSLAELERSKQAVAKRSFLRGMLTGALAMLALCAIVWCAWRSHNTALTPLVQADTLAEAAVMIEDTPQVKEREASQPAMVEQPAGDARVVTDTCTATMYLSKMSSKHYGKPDFWIYIYEENRDKIANPDNVAPGTVVVVPPASKYGIDPNDKASIDRARRRTYELLTH